MSTKTGFAPVRQIEPAVAKNEYGVVITSSPGPILAAIKGKSRASVPEAQPIPRAMPHSAGDLGFERGHLGPHHEHLAFEQTENHRLDFVANRLVLCLQVEGGNRDGFERTLIGDHSFDASGYRAMDVFVPSCAQSPSLEISAEERYCFDPDVSMAAGFS